MRNERETEERQQRRKEEQKRREAEERQRKMEAEAAERRRQDQLSHCACVIADLIFDLTKIELSKLITDQRHLIDDQSWWNKMLQFDLRFDRFDL